MHARLLLLAGAVALSSTVAVVSQQRRTGAFDQSINHPLIKYLTAETDTVVDRANARLRDGSARLVFDEKTGYLKSVLDLLEVPVESQVMVYTQTSLQAQHIRMDNPRAIYFNDRVSIGYVRGAGLIEIVAQDPKLGSVFYVVHQTPAGGTTFGRESSNCLRCHLSWETLGVPGMSVLTTFPRTSENDYANGGFVDHYRPIEERWGGWYVTGKRVPARHMGNYPLIVAKPISTPPPARESLAGLFSLDGYLAPYSDIVALMVLEHQAHFVNLVTRANYETRLGESSRIEEAAATLADYMLFVDEAKLPSPIEGSSGFTVKFTAQAPRDAKGRSLRELDLRTRLQKYPLSYMIYSPAFAAMAEQPKALVMRQIGRVLSGEVGGEKYAAFTPELRAAIRDILRDTLKPS
jgi:hypothetical protein